MTISGLDHLVLTVADIETSCDFYVRVLGMTRETFAGGRSALKFGSQKINLHQAGREFEPKAMHATPGSGDLCFVVDDVRAAQKQLDEEGIEIVERLVARTGAVGPILSVYCRDPDGNLIEMSEYE